MLKTTVNIKPSRSLKWLDFYTIVVILSLATAPAVLLGDDNRNFGLIGLMFVSSFFALVLLKKIKPSTDNLLLLGFALSIVLFPAFIHEETRWSTIFYSLMFCGLFISYHAALHSGNLSIEVFIKVIRYLIFAYTVVLVIQQLNVLLGMPIFNLSNYDPAEPWKLNSLSAEPSHSARIVGLLMLAYIFAKRTAQSMGVLDLRKNHKDLLLLACFLWTMITMFSVTAVFLLAIVMITFFNKINLRQILGGLIIFVIVILTLPDQLTERAFRIIVATLSLDYQKILYADHSGAMRIAPMLLLIDFVEIFSLKGLFGNGVDAVSLFMSNYITGVSEGYAGGGLLALWYDYGFISFLLFVFFTLRITAALSSPIKFIVWFLLVFFGGVNNQIVWLVILILFTLRFYDRKAQALYKHSLNTDPRQHKSVLATTTD